MKKLSQKLNLMVLAVGLAMTSTGCMTTPGDGEHIGNIESNVSFSGYLTDANTWVKIQAKHPTYGWQTIGWAKSNAWSVPYSGNDWYAWSQSLNVPLAYWTYIGTDNPKGQFKAEVRAVNYTSGKDLLNFEAGYGDWFDHGTSLEGMWAEHGHNGPVVIYGNVYVE